jgi:hypothetical protein
MPLECKIRWKRDRRHNHLSIYLSICASAAASYLGCALKKRCGTLLLHETLRAGQTLYVHQGAMYVHQGAKTESNATHMRQGLTSAVNVHFYHNRPNFQSQKFAFIVGLRPIVAENIFISFER